MYNSYDWWFWFHGGVKPSTVFEAQNKPDATSIYFWSGVQQIWHPRYPPTTVFAIIRLMFNHHKQRNNRIRCKSQVWLLVCFIHFSNYQLHKLHWLLIDFQALPSAINDILGRRELSKKKKFKKWRLSRTKMASFAVCPHKRRRVQFPPEVKTISILSSSGTFKKHAKRWSSCIPIDCF